MDHYSWVQLWMLGADHSAFRDSDGNLRPQFKAAFASVMAVPDDLESRLDPSLARVRLEQIAASSPEPHLAALNLTAKLFAREAALPDSAMSVTDYANPTSAEAYDSSQYELIHEAEGATKGFTPAVLRTAARMLATANGKSMSEYSGLQARWRSPRYLTRSAQADAGVKQISGAPWLSETEIGLELLGLTSDQIARALAEKRSAQHQAFTQTILANPNETVELNPDN
jgi:hypothetical protein